MTGLAVLQHVRVMDPDLPFIMLTGRADTASVVQARDCGVTDYLAKPFTEDALVKEIKRLVRPRVMSQ